MPETDTELAIPAASIAALMDITDGYYDTDDAAEEDVVRVAAPVVAAELRRLADAAKIEDGKAPMDEAEEAYWDGIDEMAILLRTRADVLDPPARQED